MSPDTGHLVAPRKVYQGDAVERILAVLDARLPDHVPSLEELAAVVALSRAHVSRTFHAVAGVSLRVYVRDARLQRAAELLVTSTRPVTTIALDCGFYDLPHLDKAFRGRFGTTPHDFRRRHLATASR
jgi:AraC family transcriptional regulator